jgi:L-iditol 2-dehydrogenase
MKHGFADAVYCLPSPLVPSTTTRSNGVSVNGVSKSSAPGTFSDEQIKRSKDAATAALSAFNLKDGFDVVFECTGAETPIQMCIFVSLFTFYYCAFFSVPSTILLTKTYIPLQTAATGGRVMLIGMGTRVAYLPLSTAALREVDILGSFRYADTYPEALSLLSSPSSRLRTMVSKLVTHRFELSDTKRAFEMLAKGVDEKGALVLKIIVGPGVQ